MRMELYVKWYLIIRRPWSTEVDDLKYNSKLNNQVKHIKNSMNDFGIGTMSINNSKSPFIKEQITSNLELISHLLNTYKVLNENVRSFGY